jgi:hypothetical protein
MSIALMEERFSDICLIVEKQTIFAHQCILSASSEYFSQLIDKAKGRNQRGSKLVLHLPGTYSSFMRVLGYLYSGKLPQSSEQNDLVDDLENAHRYKLVHMKSICDSRIQVTANNACDMLLLATRVESPRIRIQSIHMIVNTLNKQYEDESKRKKMVETMSQLPIRIKDELFEFIKAKNRLGCILPSDRKILSTNMLKRYHIQK